MAYYIQMYSVTVNSNDHDYLNIAYLAIKLSNYKNQQLVDHDYLLPNDVKFSIKYEKDTIYFKTYRSKEIAGTEHAVLYLNFIELSSKNIEILKEFCSDAHDVYYKDHFFEKNTVSISVPNQFGNWNHYANLQRRNINSIILDIGVKENIIERITTFKKQNKEYEKYGIPYKKAICLYGPPGTGKSSIIFTIASKFKMNIAIMNFGSGVTDITFIKLISNLPDNCILLLEDIDALFTKRKAESGSQDGFLSFSTVLNVLDGNLRKNGLITFITTNHLEQLDPALLRKGRMDDIIEIGYIQKAQIIEFGKLFYPKITKNQLDEYCLYISSIKKLSPSVLSSFMFFNRHLSINDLLKLLKTNKTLT